MANTKLTAARARGGARGGSATPRARALGPAELAWIALLPCAALAAAAIALLGPPLGRALFPAGAEGLWPPGWWETEAHPEPVKQGRYVLAALAPLLLVAAVRLGVRRELTLGPQAVRALRYASYAALTAVVAVSLSEQDLLYDFGEPAPAIFGTGAVVAAAILLAVALVALAESALGARLAALARETPARRRAALALALAFTAVWLLKGITSDGLTGDFTGLNLPWTMNDALAVLNGRTPLVDYHSIYAKLMPYPTALVLGALGTTILAYTVWMAVLNGLALLAVFAVFRLVTRSSLLALGLFAPFVAASDLGTIRIVDELVTVSPLTLSAMWPMRYGGVFLLAWLTARHVAGRRPQSPWALFLVGGLVTVNALEFGLGAVLATAAALLCARPPRSAGAALRLAAQAAAGTLGALALTCLLTLARAGELPSLDLFLEWPRIFTRLGWFSMPLPVLGLHLAVYATFAAAIAVAAVRFARASEDVLLTSMLAWSGVFGMLAGGYFVGRPDVMKLAGLLSAWSFALSFLAVVCVRELAVREWRRPRVPELLVLFGLALSVVSLVHVPLPHEEIDRLGGPGYQDPVYLPTAERFVAERTRPGEKVVILLPMGHRIAHDLELVNVAPYPFMNAIVMRSQLQTVVDTARRERVRSIFVPAPGSDLLMEADSAPEQLALLAELGFRRRSAEAGMVELRRA